jgi:hypothetical protein
MSPMQENEVNDICLGETVLDPGGPAIAIPAAADLMAEAHHAGEDLAAASAPNFSSHRKRTRKAI